MAAISSILVNPLPETFSSNSIRNLPSKISKSNQFAPRLIPAFRNSRIQAAQSPSTKSEEEHKQQYEEPMGVNALKSFVDISLGKWNGTFYQFDSHGNLMQKVTTKLSASSYGEEDLISLLQTLYIKQPSGYESEMEWAEYKIKETNMFTVDKYQQIGFFPKEKAFSLRYQTAGMLEYVLRQGVLGEDDTGEESPKNLKIPSRRPAIVCENCLYSHETDKRARAFHILDPQGVLEMILIFLEQKGDSFPHLPSPDSQVTPFLGKWKGHSITKRSGVYGSTMAESDTISSLEINDDGQLIQDISTTTGEVTTNVHWTGTVDGSLVTFDGGFMMTLLPGGMYIGCPCNVADSVAESKSFHLEFGWMDSPGKRQRLIRTFDVEGLAVSTTYISELKV